MQEGIGWRLTAIVPFFQSVNLLREKGCGIYVPPAGGNRKEVKGADAAHAGKRQSAGEAYRATNTQTAGNEEYPCTQSGWYGISGTGPRGIQGTRHGQRQIIGQGYSKKRNTMNPANVENADGQEKCSGLV